MLVLFEGTLDRKGVADEGQYDLIRQGAIVSLGTLARHLSHDVEKARPLRLWRLPASLVCWTCDQSPG